MLGVCTDCTALAHVQCCFTCGETFCSHHLLWHNHAPPSQRCAYRGGCSEFVGEAIFCDRHHAAVLLEMTHGRDVAELWLGS